MPKQRSNGVLSAPQQKPNGEYLANTVVVRHPYGGTMQVQIDRCGTIVRSPAGEFNGQHVQNIHGHKSSGY